MSVFGNTRAKQNELMRDLRKIASNKSVTKEERDRAAAEIKALKQK